MENRLIIRTVVDALLDGSYDVTVTGLSKGQSAWLVDQLEEIEEIAFDWEVDDGWAKWDSEDWDEDDWDEVDDDDGEA